MTTGTASAASTLAPLPPALWRHVRDRLRTRAAAAGLDSLLILELENALDGHGVTVATYA